MGHALFSKSFSLCIYYITLGGATVTRFRKYLPNVVSDLRSMGWCLPIDKFLVGRLARAFDIAGITKTVGAPR
jgi:hypothetical protein